VKKSSIGIHGFCLRVVSAYGDDGVSTRPQNGSLGSFNHVDFDATTQETHEHNKRRHRCAKGSGRAVSRNGTLSRSVLIYMLHENPAEKLAFRLSPECLEAERNGNSHIDPANDRCKGESGRHYLETVDRKERDDGFDGPDVETDNDKPS
jgi:hypothetical protein